MDVNDTIQDGRETRSPSRAVARSVLLGGLVALVYLANGRELGSYDTEPATVLPFLMIRGGGPYLDPFFPHPPGMVRRLPEFVTRSRGHIVSLYPIAPALVAVPLEWPMMLFLDRARPGWDSTPGEALLHAKAMSKLTATLLVALTVVGLEHVLRRLGLGRVAWPTALAAGLGSNLWAGASQALWQHGPAALMLTLTILCLLPRPASRARLVLAGLTAGIMVACRSIDLIFAVTVLLWLVRHQPRGLPWFLPAPVVIAAGLIAYNLWFFGEIEGGQARLEAMHPELHGVDGPWSGHLAEGALGTLLSPSRGLFIFTPWVALALATLPAYARRLGPWSLVRWLLWALVPYLLVLSKYAVWWAGHCFGPRYWTDAVPLFAILLGFALDWSLARCRPVALLLGLAIAWSVAVQAVGAFLYPSGWNLIPTNVDTHHERLWDWSDTELSRCLTRAWASRNRGH